MGSTTSGTQDWRIAEISKLMERVHALKYDDYAGADCLVRDARTALRYAFGGNSDYVTLVDAIRFRPEHFLANKGNIAMTGPWNEGVSQLKEVLHDANNEIRIKSISQPATKAPLLIPERITFAWVWQNLDIASAWKIGAGAVAVFAVVASIAFSLGHRVESTETPQNLKIPTTFQQSHEATNKPSDGHTNSPPTKLAP